MLKSYLSPCKIILSSSSISSLLVNLWHLVTSCESVHVICWDESKTTQSEKRGGGLAGLVQQSEQAIVAFGHICQTIAMTVGDRIGDYHAALASWKLCGGGRHAPQCHHLRPLTDLAGSTLSDHFRDVSTPARRITVHLPGIQALTSNSTTSTIFTNWTENWEQATPRGP